MITVAIIGILTSIALPSYISYMQDGRSVEVQHYALQQTAILERQYTREGKYRDAGADSGEFDIAATDYYSFTYAPANLGTEFLLTLTPKSGSSQSDDRCGEMSIDHLGDTKGSAADCWDK